MSSLLSHNKDQPRTRKSLSDSSPTSPTATTRSLRHERVSRLNASGLNSSGSSDVSKDRAPNHTESYLSRRENRLSARKKAEEETGCSDYKKMYEEALTTNERIKSRLEVSKQELVMVQTQLQRAQRKGRIADCSSNMLETEKKERRGLEKRISDMEEELKVKTELKMENQRLKDENGALIRVISKLSK